MTQTEPLPRAGQDLRRRALQFPEAYEELPWGHHAIKVRGKSFVFLGTHAGTFSMSTKLPHSGNVALSLPFASPTEYGLGKSGWVTARFDRKAAVPVDLLAEWIEESYRAIAPKKIVAQLDGAAVAASASKPARASTGAAKPAGTSKRAGPAKRVSASKGMSASKRKSAAKRSRATQHKKR